MKKVILIGPSLATLTSGQLEELITMAGVKLSDLERRDSEDPKNSLHPIYQFHYVAEDSFHSEHITVSVWRGGLYEGGYEWDTLPWEIYPGKVVDDYGGNPNVLSIVKWFLDHGWAWGETEISS